MRKLIYGSLLLLTFFCSCKKDPLENTYKLAGNHTWVGIEKITGRIGYGVSPDTTYAVRFEHKIVVVDKNTIYFEDTMKCVLSDKNNRKLIYVHYESLFAMNSYETDTIIYNYANGAIEYKYRMNNKGHEVITDVRSL